MNINAIEELDRVLGEIEERIRYIESSPNRVFVLVEYDTISLFHWFNEVFKEFYDEFDHSASQLLLFRKFAKKHSELTNRYIALFREQIDYLEEVIDVENKTIKNLPPIYLSEDNRTDVIGYYMERFKDEADENGKSLCEIDLDTDHCFETVNGKEVPIDFYTLQSDELNDKHFKGLFSMYECLSSIYPLISTICSYPKILQLGYEPGEEETILALDKLLRQYARDIGQSVHRELKKIFLELKRSNNHLQPSDVWAQVLEVEANAFRLAISEQLVENREKIFDHYDDDKRKLWTDNYQLLQKIKDICIDDELFDVRLAVEDYNLLSVLNADNLDLFCELVLRRNIIHREMYPDKLQVAFDVWVNPSNGQKPKNSYNSISELNDSLNKVVEGAKHEINKTEAAGEKPNPVHQQEEEPNFFAPKKILQELLKQAWFAKVRTDEKYDTAWTDNFIEALMASKHGETIARQWAVKGGRNKRNQIKGYVLGLLKDAGVLEGSYDEIARKTDMMDKSRSFSRKLGDGKKQPYAEWVVEWVRTHNIEEQEKG